MKYIVAVTVFVLSAVTGFNKSALLTKRCEVLAAVLAFLRHWENEITYSKSTVKVIIETFSESKDGHYLDFLKECSVLSEHSDFPSAWQEAIKKHPLCLSENEANAVRAIGEKIGIGDTYSQLRQIEYFRQFFEAALKSSGIKEKENKGLYISLGIALGAVSFILIM